MNKVFSINRDRVKAELCKYFDDDLTIDEYSDSIVSIMHKLPHYQEEDNVFSVRLVIGITDNENVREELSASGKELLIIKNLKMIPKCWKEH